MATDRKGRIFMNENPKKNASGLTTDPVPPSKSQRFIKNNQYFTICIYAAVMMVICAVIFKCIIDIEKTKAWVGQILTMLSPFIFGALLAYVLNPMVHMFYRTIGRICDKAKIHIKHKPRLSLF